MVLIITTTLIIVIIIITTLITTTKVLVPVPDCGLLLLRPRQTSLPSPSLVEGG